MNMKERELADWIRAASPCEKAPAELETRIMKRVRECEERRRCHRAIGAMAWVCAKTAVAVILLLYVAIRRVDVPAKMDGVSFPFELVGVIFAFGITCCYDEGRRLFADGCNPTAPAASNGQNETTIKNTVL